MREVKDSIGNSEGSNYGDLNMYNMVSQLYIQYSMLFWHSQCWGLIFDDQIFKIVNLQYLEV